MYERISISAVDPRQWLLGIRQAALTVHDDIYRSLKPVLGGRQLSLSDKNRLSGVTRDIVGQKGASMFVLLSAARLAKGGYDGVEGDVGSVPEIAHFDALISAIHKYLATTGFLDSISHQLSSPRLQTPDFATDQIRGRFEMSGRALKSLLDQVDRCLGVSHIDYRQKHNLTPNAGLQHRNQVS